MAKRYARRGLMRGITLIELMIVVVIIAIIGAVAYPSYQGQVQRSRRADGKAALLNTAQRLERCYTRFGRYNDGGCDVAFPIDSPERFYQITAVARTANSFALAATPQGAQTADTRCGVLRLDNLGQQGSQNQPATDANDCW